MAWLRRDQGLFESNRVTYIKHQAIRPNPAQPRRIFDPDGLRELADSIRQYGVLQPLSVRRTAVGYELIAGERRLRASRMAGLQEVPCIIMGLDEEQSSLVALVENLQRRDLDYIEEAEGLQRLIQSFGLSQEEAARRVGKSQSAVANKLRLLRHPPEVIQALREHNLTERHARALLRLEDGRDRARVLQTVIERQLNVAQTDEFIEEFLKRKQEPEKPTKIRSLYIIKDVRMFLNTVSRAVSMMKKSGVKADLDRSETDQDIVITIRVPKKIQVG